MFLTPCYFEKRENCYFWLSVRILNIYKATFILIVLRSSLHILIFDNISIRVPLNKKSTEIKVDK